LDQATSGILVLARNRKAAQVLTKTWAAHRILRLYWAILIGKPKGKQGIIDISVSKSESPNESNEDNVDPPRPSKKGAKLLKYFYNPRDKDC
jgi:23S rRNA-/tRNA-specific pseudouridylate synthase